MSEELLSISDDAGFVACEFNYGGNAIRVCTMRLTPMLDGAKYRTLLFREWFIMLLSKNMVIQDRSQNEALK